MSSPRILFKLRYWDDPAGFVRDCIKFRPGDAATFYQLEILDHIIPEKRVTARGPHGMGKTTMASWAILWFALTRDGLDWKVATTASVWRQLTKFLWPEVRKWARMLRWDIVGRKPLNDRTELHTMSLRLRTGEAFALASSDPSGIEGVHADHLLYVFDEAKAIPFGTFDAAEGAFMAATQRADTEAYAMAISTPGAPEGRLYDIHSRKPGYEDWWVRHVTCKECIDAGRLDPEKVEQRARQWGRTSPTFQTRVMGEFAHDDEHGIIPLSWVNAAIARHHEWMAEVEENPEALGVFTALGVDVGGGTESGDPTTLALAYDIVKILEIRKYQEQDPETALMQTVGRVKGILDQLGGVAYVDVIGIGGGVFSRLREMHMPAKAFVASKKTDFKDVSGELGFANWRAAAWWITRELLDPTAEVGVCLPDDEELIGELTVPKHTILSTSKIQVEKKEQIRKRISRSTNCADAVVQALVGPHLVREERDRNKREVVNKARRTISGRLH